MKGEAIPLSARIVAAADVFDTLSVARYKPAFSLERNIEIIPKGADGQFDPELVDMFLTVVDEMAEWFGVSGGGA